MHRALIAPSMFIVFDYPGANGLKEVTPELIVRLHKLVVQLEINFGPALNLENHKRQIVMLDFTYCNTRIITPNIRIY